MEEIPLITGELKYYCDRCKKTYSQSEITRVVVDMDKNRRISYKDKKELNALTPRTKEIRVTKFIKASDLTTKIDTTKMYQIKPRPTEEDEKALLKLANYLLGKKKLPRLQK